MSLADLATITSLVGLVSLLDLVVRPAPKRALSRWFGRVISQGKLAFAGSGLMDRLFGPQILGWKAAPRYALVSVASIALSFGFAYFTSPPEVQQTMQILPEDSGALDYLMVGICLTAAICGDLLSYAQTRMFVRQIDGTRNAVVMLGLLAADLAVSLAIFLGAFSLARLACIALVLQADPSIKLTHSEAYSPTLVRDFAAEHSERGAKGEASTLVAVLAQTPVNPDEVSAAVADNFRQLLPADNPLVDVLVVSTEEQCADSRSMRERQSIADKTAGIAFAAAMEVLPRNHDLAWDAEDSVQSANVRLGAAGTAAPGCQFDVLSVTIGIRASDLMALAGPGDAWFASFERTLFDTYGVVGQKFSPYVSFDPYDDVPAYLGSLAIQMDTSILGLTHHRLGTGELVGLMIPSAWVKGPEVSVPFSPMAASSLTTFVFLLAYISFLGLAFVRIQAVRSMGALVPKLDTEKAFFTTISIAVIAIIIASAMAQWLASVLWSALLS